MYSGRLLSKSAKTIKSDGAGLGYLTRILYLAPSRLSGVNVCSHASPGCIKGCLNKSGNGLYPKVQMARIEKTKFYLEQKQEFLKRLKVELKNFSALCILKNLKPTVRLNGTSDIPWERVAPSLFSQFPEIQFYDYTKNPKRMLKFLRGEMPSNYYITFSRSESNEEDVETILKAKGNVCVVFYVSKYSPFPTKWKGRIVRDGDKTDLRFLDKRGVIGLRAKGVGKTDKSGFVIRKIKHVSNRRLVRTP